MKNMGRRKTTPSVGSQLREAREAKGQPLAAAALALHIPVRQLEALEEDAAAQAFAAPVYAFGALRSYAAWLGLNAKPLERALAGRLKADHASKSPLKVHILPAWYEQFISPRTAIVASGLLVAAAVGSYVAWQIRSFWRLPALAITAPQQALVVAAEVVVAGQTEAGARVKVNEQPVILDQDAAFAQTILLDPGITIIRVEAANAAGRVRIVEKHLLRPRDGGTVN